MTQAKIEINAVAGSDTDLPINTTVQLSNEDVGGESTYLWTILDQPPGTADNLSSSIIENPTFVPKKEGTYLIRLIVNQSLPDEKINLVVAGIRQLKTRVRVPAAGETIEADTADGWAVDVDSILRLVDTLRSDPDLVIGIAGAAGLGKGAPLFISGVGSIKVGLPGEEKLPGFLKALANDSNQLSTPLHFLEAKVSGSLPTAIGDLIVVRTRGRLADVSVAGTPAYGQPVYVTDTGTLSTVSGTYTRFLGFIVADNSPFFDVAIDGAIQPQELRVRSLETVEGVTVGTDLDVAGSSQFTGDTSFDGNNSFNAPGNSIFNNGLSVTGSSFISSSGSLQLKSATGQPIKVFVGSSLFWEFLSNGVLRIGNVFVSTPAGTEALYLKSGSSIGFDTPADGACTVASWSGNDLDLGADTPNGEIRLRGSEPTRVFVGGTQQFVWLGSFESVAGSFTTAPGSAAFGLGHDGTNSIPLMGYRNADNSWVFLVRFHTAGDLVEVGDADFPARYQASTDHRFFSATTLAWQLAQGNNALEFYKTVDGGVMVTTNFALKWGTNNVYSWEVTNGGVLTSISGPRLISGVATPVAGTDAANKDYVDAVPTVLQTLTARVSTDPTTTTSTASPPTVALLTIPITTIASTKLVISAAISTSNSGVNQTNYFTVVVDSTIYERGSTFRAGANSTGGVPINAVVTGLSAGSHTVYLYWGTSGGTAQVRPNNTDYEATRMIVQEVSA